MSSPSRAPVPAPKPKPKPRVPQKPESEDALKGKSMSEQNGLPSPEPPDSAVAPDPRTRTATHVVPSSASTQDGGLAPQARPRVGTNPVTMQERSPTHHRRSASDAKREDEGDAVYDSPWGKKLRPAISKKPTVPSASSLVSHRSSASSGETSPNNSAPLKERVQSHSANNSPSHLHASSSHRQPKSTTLSVAEIEGTDLQSGMVNGSQLVSPRKSTPPPAPPRPEASSASVNQPLTEEDHNKESSAGGEAVVKKPRPPRPPPYAASKQTLPEKERNGDEVGGGEEGKDSMHKSGDVQLPMADTHDTPQEEGPTTPTPFSPTAKQTAMEPSKLLKSPKHPTPPPRPHPAPPTKYTAEKVAADMEFFTMELLKAGSSAPVGMVVKVKPISTLPEVKGQVTGPFIEKVQPMGAADKDGRACREPGAVVCSSSSTSSSSGSPASTVVVSRSPLPSPPSTLHRAQAGDLVAEANGHSLLGCSQQEATQRINEPGKSVRLKLGRSLAAGSHLNGPKPIMEDLTVVADVGHAPKPDMSHSGDEASAAKIENLLMEKSRLEGERDHAVDQLALFKKEMQAIIDEKEQATAEALSKSAAAQEKLSTEVDALKQQMASITREKEEENERVAKSVEDKNMEIASLSSQVASLHEQLDEQRAQVQLGDTAAGSQGDQETAEEKREVSSSKGLEHQLQKLQAEMAAVTTQSTEKDKRIADLKGGLSEALPKLQEAEKHITSLKEDIKVKAERIISLESEVKLMKESEAALEQAKEEAERKWKDERERVQSLEVPAKDEQRVEELQKKVEELQKELESSRTRATEVEERCRQLEETVATLKEAQQEKEAMNEDEDQMQSTKPRSPVVKPRIARQDSKPLDGEEEESETGEKLPPKPTPKPRPRKKMQVEPSGTEEGKSEEDGIGSRVDQDREGEENVKAAVEDSEEGVVVEGEEKDGEEEKEVPNFDDFDAVSEHTSRVSSNVLKERVRVGRNRPRKAPSREHLNKISLGDIGEDLPLVQLKVLEDDEHETRHSRQLSSSALGPAPAPPIVMPKPVREVKRARSADNLLGDGGGGSAPNTPHRVPGGVQLVPVFPGRPPLKKSLSGNSLDPDTDGSHHQPAEVLMEQTDGTGSGKSSPSKPGLGSRPGSARGAFGSVDSLDKLGGEVWSGSGISLLTAPEWSSEQVAHWLQRVGLGKHSDGATEKGFSGRQLMELDSGKVKALGMTKEDVSLLKKEVKLLKRLHEKAKKDEKKRVEAEKKEAKKKKK